MSPSAANLRRTWIFTSVAAVFLVTPRTLGPLWLALIVLSLLLLCGVHPYLRLYRTHTVRAVAATALVSTAVVASVLWTRQSGGVALPPGEPAGSARLTTILEQVPTWNMQVIAAFPLRNEPAPTIVYVVYFVFGITALFASWRRANRRLRISLSAMAFLSIVIPVALTLATISRAGLIWQGRYGLAYFIGLPVLAGFALARRPSNRFDGPFVAALTLGLAIAHTVSALGVFTEELTSPAASTDDWWPLVPAWGVALLALAGVALLTIGMGREALRNSVGDRHGPSYAPLQATAVTHDQRGNELAAVEAGLPPKAP
jgi:hypothetical protein